MTPPDLQLKIYIIGNDNSIDDHMQRIREQITDAYDLTVSWEVVDLNKYPEEAEEQQILAIPTLIKQPSPTVRIVGKLSEVERIVSLICKDFHLKSTVASGSGRRSKSRQ